MFCPHTIVWNGRHLLITRHERSDYHCGTPLGQVLNPLRYSFTLRPGRPGNYTINRDGRLARLWSDFNWHLWRKHFVR